MRALAWAALLLLAGGCSRGGDPEQEAAFKGATRTLEVDMRALRDGDCKTAYGCLSWQRRKEISLEAVEADYAAHRDRYHYRAGAKIEKCFYDDFRVIAKLVDGDGNGEFVSVVPEDGKWKIQDKGRNIFEILARAGHPGGRSPEGAPKGP